MFDAHCHLTDIDDPEEVLQQAWESGVRSVLCCGYHSESNRAVCDLHQRVPQLPFALGLHPWFAEEPVAPVLEAVERWRPVAVGEAGLDLWGDPSPAALERQFEVLEAQLALAARLGLPVTLHSRKAVAAIAAVLQSHPKVRGALHAYSGSYEQAKPLVDRGFYIGVGGAVTRIRAKRVRRCAQALPLDCIVLETDAPAIGMDGVEPPLVRPAHLGRVATALAELRDISVEQVVEQTDANAVELFGPRVAAVLGREVTASE